MHTKSFTSEMFFCVCVCWSNLIHSHLYVCSASLKELCSFIPSLTLEYGKRSYCIGKSLEKVLQFGPKNQYKHCVMLKYFVMGEEVSQLTNASVYHCTVILLATVCPFCSSVY